MAHVTAAGEDRVITLGPGAAAIPERLLLAHARGEVLFIAGAGISQPAGLPGFRDLVLGVYASIDPAIHSVISRVPAGVCNQWHENMSGLTNQQAAEIKRFISGDYDVVFGMLERRIDGRSHGKSRVRQAVAEELRRRSVKPASTHRSLMRLADRGGAVTIVTTNFDLLLERAAHRTKPRIQSYSLGGTPRPGRAEDFAGILHVHGALARDPARASEVIITDRDFGEFYLRRRVVPDFIYDAARLFNLVLVGYSANDPPMRYLLNAVAADGIRFGDLKERFTFIGSASPDGIAMEDWKGRGITPIPYDSTCDHAALSLSLSLWADISPRNGKKGTVDAHIKRIVRQMRGEASEADRDLFDHFVRRSDSNERVRIAQFASAHRAHIGWLDAISSISSAVDLERR